MWTGLSIQSRVERTHPEQTLHMSNLLKLYTMNEQFIQALEPNQGHATAIHGQCENTEN